MARFRELLRSRDFVLLWIGQMVSQCGDRLTQLALVAIVTGLRPGSAMELAGLVACTVAPTFCVGPFAGVFVDRWDRRRTMIVCDWLRAALVAAIVPLAALPRALPLVYLDVFLIFSVTRFFLPAKMAILPELVANERLLIANSVTGASGLAAAGISFALGGWVIATLGVVGGLLADMATYLVSATALALMHVRFQWRQLPPFEEAAPSAPALQRPTQAVVRQVWREMVDGVHWLVGAGHLRATVAAMSLIWSAVGILAVVGTIWVQRCLGVNPAHLGFLASLLLVGVLAGSLAFGRLAGRWDRDRSIRWSLVAVGVVIIGFALVLPAAPSAAVAGALVTLLGVAAAPATVCVPTMLQERLPSELRGRIFSSLTLLADGAMMLCLLVGAALADRVGPMSVLLALGVGVIVGGAVAFRRVEGG